MKQLSTETVNKILHDIDPVGTSCKYNEGMEFEYWSTADCAVQFYNEYKRLDKDDLMEFLCDIFGVPERFINIDGLNTALAEIIGSLEERHD